MASCKYRKPHGLCRESHAKEFLQQRFSVAVKPSSRQPEFYGSCLWVLHLMYFITSSSQTRSGFGQFRMHEKSGFQPGLHILRIYCFLLLEILYSTPQLLSSGLLVDFDRAQLRALIIKYGYLQDL